MSPKWTQWKSMNSTFWSVFDDAFTKFEWSISSSNNYLGREMDPLWQSWAIASIARLWRSTRFCFQKSNCSKKGLWWLSGCPSLVLFITAFGNLTRTSLSTFSANNCMESTFKLSKMRPALVNRRGPVLIRDMLPERQSRNSPTWDTRLCHTHHIPLNLPPTDSNF